MIVDCIVRNSFFGLCTGVAASGRMHRGALVRGFADQAADLNSIDHPLPTYVFTLSSLLVRRASMATAAAVPYRYRPLRHPDAIRILELLPGPSSSPLRCRLIECKIGEVTFYEALSYTWNGNTLDHIVLVEDAAAQGILRITENLHDAFQALRKPDQPFRLWADAVCINQSDAQEKSCQVPRMGQIFRHAARVIIWLGAGSLEIVEALRQVVNASDTEAPVNRSFDHLVDNFTTIPW
jgi:hypothetical protein